MSAPTFLGVDSVRWLLAAAVFVLTALVVRLALRVALGRVRSLASRTRTDVDDLIVQLLTGTKTLFVLLVSVWAAAEVLELPDPVPARIDSLVVIGLIAQAAFWGSGAVSFLIDRYRAKRLVLDPGGATAIGAMSFLGRAFVWCVAALLILDNLGIDVTALITGLGIGGVAVALALQNVLKDLLASLAIVLDRPFVVGDALNVGDINGTVEYVGLKTTRLRALSGEQIIVSNSDLLDSRIRNYKRMEQRRAVFTIGVTYETPAAQLARIPEIIRGIVTARPGLRFDRSHFKSYGAFSLDFETVYYVLTPDYGAYMDAQQAINLELFTRFASEGIEFAYPTQTVLARVTGADAVRPAQPLTT